MKVLVTGGAGFIGSAVLRHIINTTNDTVINVDKLTYAGNLESIESISDNERYFFEKVDIQVDNKNPIFNTYVAIDSIDSNFYDASEFSLINVTLKDTLFMRSEFKGGTNNEDNFNLEFYHTINEDNKSVIGLRKSDFTFKGYTWYANQNKSKSDNKIIFDNRFETVRIRPISLTHTNEKIEVSGVTKGSDFKDIKAVFSEVDLYKITPSLDSLRFKGVVDGNLRIFQEEGVYFPSSTISIDDLQIKVQKDKNLIFILSFYKNHTIC